MFLGWGLTQRVGFLGSMGGRSLVVFQGRKVGFKKISKELFFWWCGMRCLEKACGYFFFCHFFFCDMVT
jgi:hypothetical protein